jgi:hypothetical protein
VGLSLLALYHHRVLATQSQISKGEKNQAIYNLFAAYLQTVPLQELIDSVERSRRDAQLRHVVLYGATCSFCLSRAARLDGSYLRTFALELKEQLVQTRRICHVDSSGAAWAPKCRRSCGASSSLDH